MSVIKVFRKIINIIMVLSLFAAASWLLLSCGGNKNTPQNKSQAEDSTQAAGSSSASQTDSTNKAGTAGEAQTGAAENSNTAKSPPLPPLSTSYFVLDPQTNTVFELKRTDGTILHKYAQKAPVVAIAFDTEKNLLYEAIGGKNPGLSIFDVSARKFIKQLHFPQQPSAMFFHPTQRRLYMVSADSSYFSVFDADSMKFDFDIRMRIQNNRAIGPTTLEIGPLNKLVTANGKNASVTQILTENRYMYQTVVMNKAYEITSAAFSFDGNSAFATDTQQGAIFRIQFGSGKYLAEKYKLVKPRDVCFDVNSRTVCVVENNNEVAMYNPDTFAETGRVSLSKYGDKILKMNIPPHANYAELLLDYKGVTRWLIMDLSNWEMLRFTELI
jgi:hypothetical protein